MEVFMNELKFYEGRGFINEKQGKELWKPQILKQT